MAKNAELHISVMPSTKERLIRFCKEHEGITQGDVVEDALKNFFEKQDRQHSAPDLVLDRINALTLSFMECNRILSEVKDKIDRMEE